MTVVIHLLEAVGLVTIAVATGYVAYVSCTATARSKSLWP